MKVLYNSSYRFLESTNLKKKFCLASLLGSPSKQNAEFKEKQNWGLSSFDISAYFEKKKNS